MRGDSHRVLVRRLVCLLLLLVAGRTRASVGFAAGTGTASDPYQITTAEQLLAIGRDAYLLTKDFELLADIDLDPNLPGGRVFSEAPIGVGIVQAGKGLIGAFSGTFDGKGHVIRNLVIRSDSGEQLGLFGLIGPDGRVCNLHVDNADIQGRLRLGALAGWNWGRIDHCYTSGHIRGRRIVGGLVGHNQGEIAHSGSAATVAGNDESLDLGGLVGMHGKRSITGCQAGGGVSAGRKSSNVGGLIGSVADAEATVTECKAVGPVSAGAECTGVGGLVGFGEGAISRCCSSGGVTTGDRSQLVGGLVGYFRGQSIVDCYAGGNIAAGRMTSPAGGLLGSTYRMRGTVANCHATGKLACEDARTGVGGLIGQVTDRDASAVRNCFWSAEGSGVSTSAAGTNVTVDAMRDVTTYRAAGWDFDSIWIMAEDKGYPLLRWQQAKPQP